MTNALCMLRRGLPGFEPTWTVPDKSARRGKTLTLRSFADLALPEPQPGGDVSPVTLYATTG